MDFLPREECEGQERVLRRRDKTFIIACVVVAAVTLSIGFYLYPKVNPEASIHFLVSRSASEKVALSLLQQIGVNTQGDHHAGRFTFDDEAKTFLERALGAEAANRLMAGDVRMWRWGHRWFRPLQKEEVAVEVATTGEIASFDHDIPEEAPGADLPWEQARALAEQLLSGPLHASLSGLEFQDVKTEKRLSRTDHTFTWKRSGDNWQGGDYRLEVRIQGDQPGGYREYVRIPENWTRDYAKLRSKNMGASIVASVLFILTALAMLVVLVRRIRLRDIRWRTAAIFGLIGTALNILAGLNSLPSAFYDYDTTASYGGFLITQLLSVARSGILLGLVIFVFTAAGETLYREAYPGKMSLTRFFTGRGLRTRRFFLSTILGLTLTCFFFFYQEVFYSVARRLGAWAPMDVPYDDLLNTAFPWVFILLFGFMPAVTEEFLSRMFSIPFLRKYTRSALLAVVVPAFIWGFGHSAYPNQPFYIRGLEVGLAGILVGIVMLRMNVVATLVWHFTVDALYTSYLLFRSGNSYYVVSAAVAGGILLVPLIYSIVCYLRRGGFEDPAELLNRAEAGPAPLPAGPRRAEEATAPEAAAPVEPCWSGRKRVTVLAAAAASLALLLIPGADLKDSSKLQLSRADAGEAAKAELLRLGESPDSFRVLLLFRSDERPAEAKYILQRGGVDRLKEEYANSLPPRSWTARFFRPLQAKEINLSLDSDTGRLLALDRHVAEKDSLPSLGREEAEALARVFLVGQGIDLATLDLKDASQEKRPRRMDHAFVWEAKEGDPRNIGQAHHRIEVGVQGDQIGTYRQRLKLPEDWVRQREKRTAVTSLRLLLAVAVGGSIAGLLLWNLIVGVRGGLVRWRPILLTSIPMALFFLIGGLNNWPMLLSRYDTTYPWSVFLITMGAGMAMSLLLGALLTTVSLALITVTWPQSWTLRADSVRAHLRPDAFLAALAGLAFFVVLQHLEGVMLKEWPALAPAPGLPRPSGTSTVIPWLGIVSTMIRAFLVYLGLAAGALGLFGLRRRYRGWTAVLLLGAVIALVPMEAQTAGEFLLGLGWSLIQMAALLAIVRWLLAGNLLATPLMIYLALAVRGVAPFISAEGSSFRTAGITAAVVLLLPVLGLLLSPARRPAESRRSSQ
jgi:membrane protease YdiL (CAAX protease family)